MNIDELSNDSSSNLLSDNTADITDLSDDRSNDLNNISAWLDSLQTPNNNSDDITEWLDKLNTSNDFDTKEDDVTSDESDISFDFLEDLLPADNNQNQDDRQEQ